MIFSKATLLCLFSKQQPGLRSIRPLFRVHQSEFLPPTTAPTKRAGVGLIMQWGGRFQIPIRHASDNAEDEIFKAVWPIPDLGPRPPPTGCSNFWSLWQTHEGCPEVVQGEEPWYQFGHYGLQHESGADSGVGTKYVDVCEAKSSHLAFWSKPLRQRTGNTPSSWDSSRFILQSLCTYKHGCGFSFGHGWKCIFDSDSHRQDFVLYGQCLCLVGFGKCIPYPSCRSSQRVHGAVAETFKLITWSRARAKWWGSSWRATQKETESSKD